MRSANDGVTRRRMITQAASAAAALAATAAMPAVAGDRSRTDPGPTNPPLDVQNPDSAWPPATDSKSLVQTFKYPFSFANKRAYEGGWSRESLWTNGPTPVHTLPSVSTPSPGSPG